MSSGLIIKALSGFYYVRDFDSNETVACRARGKFRKDEMSPLVGDKIEYSKTVSGEGVVVKIFPRKNSLIRPSVANIDKLFVILSAKSPEPNTFVADRVIMNAEYNHIEPVIVVNKSDLSYDSASAISKLYSNAGYTSFCVSAKSGKGIDNIISLINGCTCAFAGNTGVGKSSLLNCIDPNLSISTGDISEKLGRGRHTTRHIELYALHGGYIADTPGFSSFDTAKCGFIRKDDVADCFREFDKFFGGCRFTSCSHTKEQGCAIIDAVNRGDISKSRWESYKRFYEEAAAVPDWQIDKNI